VSRGPPPQGLRGPPPRREEKSPPTRSVFARFSRRGRTQPIRTSGSASPEGSGRSSYMESRSFLIVHDSGAPCQLACARFTPVRAVRIPSRGKNARPFCAVHGISHEGPWDASVTPEQVFTPVAGVNTRTLEPRNFSRLTVTSDGFRPRSWSVMSSPSASGWSTGRQNLSTGDLLQGRRMDHVQNLSEVGR